MKIKELELASELKNKMDQELELKKMELNPGLSASERKAQLN